MTPDPSILELDAVTGGYGGAEIIHEVSVRVAPAEIVVLIGPNGAGKSSVMNAVLGRLRIDGGRVRLAGRDITGAPPEQVVRQGVCYVPQTENIFPNLSVNENLEMGAYIRTDDFRPRLEEMYELFPPLADRRRAPAGTLSGGQRQMVAIAKALMVEPVILLLDEPTAGLSPRFRGDIFRVVREINARGTPILMVEQNARQALGIADRGYVLVDGRNRLEGVGHGLLADPDVGAMFLGGGNAPETRAPVHGANEDGGAGRRGAHPDTEARVPGAAPSESDGHGSHTEMEAPMRGPDADGSDLVRAAGRQSSARPPARMDPAVAGPKESLKTLIRLWNRR